MLQRHLPSLQRVRTLRACLPGWLLAGKPR